MTRRTPKKTPALDPQKVADRKAKATKRSAAKKSADAKPK